ncbi:MAG TPA: hypothetical protein VM577_15535 [Anaerovoracaceae bacterium]|nr:hypothetical protein [Anaerovoracaceae bacterium]
MSKKRKTEVEMRRNILNHAKSMGFEGDIQKIFDRYDNLLKNCTNPEEKYQIQIMAVAELHKAMCCPGALIIDGVEILPAMPGFDPQK